MKLCPYKVHATWFYNKQRGSILVDTSNDGADSKRSNGGIEGIHLNEGA